MDAPQHEEFSEAFVLHRRPYRESSLLVDFLTRDAGIVPAVARSGRRRGVTQLEPFRPLAIRWRGRGELKTLVQIEPRGALPPLSQSVVWSGLYANEMIMRLCARFDAHPGLFDAYSVLIHGLVRLRELVGAAAALREQWLLRVFEKTVLATLGYGMLLTHDAQSGAPVCTGQVYEYDLDRGPLPLSVERMGGSGIRIQGQSLLALAAECFETVDSLVEAKHLLRAAIDARLGSVVLRSRRLRLDVERVQRRVSGLPRLGSEIDA
jgi:DNA repair protein RecO (recombination protein O)